MRQIIKGQKWRYIGSGSEFYTPGKVYEVLLEPGDSTDMFQMTDDRECGPHHWTEATLTDLFELANGPVRIVTRKEIVPGQYGNLNIGVNTHNDRQIGVTVEVLTSLPVASAELQRMAATLTEIADALGEAS